MSYSELQVTFENLHREVVNAFKKLVSNKRIFSYLEAKILETEKQMEAVKQYMVDVQKFKKMRMKNPFGSVVRLVIFKKKK